MQISSPSLRKEQTMIVPSRALARFERRWEDYCWVLEQGTEPDIGTNDPKLLDARAEVTAILGPPPQDPFTSQRVSIDALIVADERLSSVWQRDLPCWPWRLRPFLQRLSKPSVEAFHQLVNEGCQPDALAYQFHIAGERTGV